MPLLTPAPGTSLAPVRVCGRPESRRATAAAVAPATPPAPPLAELRVGVTAPLVLLLGTLPTHAAPPTRGALAQPGAAAFADIPIPVALCSPNWPALQCFGPTPWDALADATAAAPPMLPEELASHVARPQLAARAAQDAAYDAA